MTKRAEKPANRTQTARHFRVSLPTVDGWVRRGAPCIERGGYRLFDLDELEIWRIFQDKKNGDEYWRDVCATPIAELLKGVMTAHSKISFFVRANHWSHRNRAEIFKRLLQICEAVDELGDLTDGM